MTTLRRTGVSSALCDVRRRTLVGDEGQAVGEREDVLTNRTDSEGFAIFDPRVFGMVGALVGSSTTNNLQVRSQNGQLN
eukprot:SAG31_NODE_3921_length_3749_cov_6.133973_2_plen_79_part_00